MDHLGSDAHPIENKLVLSEGCAMVKALGLDHGPCMPAVSDAVLDRFPSAGSGS